MRAKKERGLPQNQRGTAARLLLECEQLREETQLLLKAQSQLKFEIQSRKGAKNVTLDEEKSRLVMIIAQQHYPITAVELATQLNLSARNVEQLLKELKGGNYIKSTYHRGAAFTYCLGDEGWNFFIEHNMLPQTRHERFAR